MVILCSQMVMLSGVPVVKWIVQKKENEVDWELPCRTGSTRNDTHSGGAP